MEDDTNDLLEQLRTRHIKLGYELPTESLFSAAADEIERLNGLEARLREALEDIASGRYSGVLLTSFPPKDPAVERARAALAQSEPKP